MEEQPETKQPCPLGAYVLVEETNLYGQLGVAAMREEGRHAWDVILYR